MTHESISFAASDGFELHTYRWSPAGEVKAVLHLAHGMGEHALRYDEFANELTAEGYEVVAQDHRGHGESAEPDGLGSFGRGGWDRVITDQHELIKHSAQRRPAAALVLLGHSMGASLVQQYLGQYDDGLDAVVLSGTPGFGGRFSRLVAYWMARYESWRHGPDNPSERLANLLFGKANTPFEDAAGPSPSGSEWLSRDAAQVRLYVDDPLCGFVLRPGSLVGYLRGARATQKPQHVAAIPKRLPVYLFSGSADPVHGGGRNIERLLKAYRGAGLSVTERIYPEGRHEMLNETNRAQVVDDLNEWLRATL